MTQKGMRLVAMIEEKENGQYEVINFLPDLKIKHITGKEFEVIEDQNYIKIPYAQGIDDLTVIVGESGVGKTRLVNDIFSLDEKKLFVFENKRNNYYALNQWSANESTWRLIFKSVSFVEWWNNRHINDDEWEEEEEDDANIDWFINRVAIVKLSNAVESASPWGQGIDLSTTRLLKNDHYDSLLPSDMDRQIKFLLSDACDAKQLERLLGFSGKHLSLVIKKEFISEVLNKESKFMSDKSYLEEVEKFDMSQFRKIEEKIHFYLTDYLAHIYSIVKFPDYSEDNLNYLGLFYKLDTMVIEDKKQVKNRLSQMIDEAIDRKKDVNTYIDEWLHPVLGDKLKIAVAKAAYKYQFYSYTPKQRIEAIKKLISHDSKIDIEHIEDLYYHTFNENYTAIALQYQLVKKQLALNLETGRYESRYFIKSREKVEKLIDLQVDIITNKEKFNVQLNRRWRRSFPFLRAIISALTFCWPGLSSGQLALLNLFGRLHSLAEEVKDKESILLLLDEVDLGLHPEWQRKWISTALPIIGEIFKGKHVQIILTTHSPIMLSDIYGENVLMLRKDPETGERQVVYGGEVTSTSFGQNIHQLFKESFFLEQTKGDYSLKVINATIRAVYDLNQEGADEAAIKADFASELGVGGLSDGQFRAYLEKVIGAIGEKLIAQKLQDMYQTIPLWSQASSLEGKRAGDLSTEELRQLLRQREETGQ